MGPVCRLAVGAQAPTGFPPAQRLYGNLLQRQQLLEGLQKHLRACGWVVPPASEWSEHDLEIPGPGPYRLSLTTVYEDDVAHAVHYVRYRVTRSIKSFSAVPFVVLALAVAALAQTPWLLPLAPPLALLLRKFVAARTTMIDAVSQFTAEYGAAIGMDRALDDF